MLNRSQNFFKNSELKTPIIFDKKKNKKNLKNIVYINSDTGKMRHYPAAAQE